MRESDWSSDVCSSDLSVQAEDKDISLAVDIVPALEIMADANRLEEVFNNLLDNAIKNSPPGSRVTVAGRKDGNLARGSVSAQGPGIPPEQLPYVFERVYQGRGVCSGVGLGLAIARGIVEAHGGRIAASNMPGSGARFSVELPLSQ
jgi:signal transduction histidine kinase